MKTILVNELTVDVDELFAQHREGARFFCSRCKTELVSAFTMEEAKKIGLGTGIHCPKNLNHVNIHFNIKR
jgi:hypothetical protein